MRAYGAAAKQLRALAHPVRLWLLEVLREQPACVCDLVAATRRRQPYVSQQLGVLRRAGLVRGDREGSLMRYRLAGPHVARLVDELRPHLGVPGGEAKSAARPQVEAVAAGPIVEGELCTGCRACFEGCPAGVYDWDEAGSLPVVARPGDCLIDCRSCWSSCTTGAISLVQEDAPAVAPGG